MTIRGMFRSLPVAISLTVLLAPSAMAQVFINEIHYDNSGTDVGEAIEVAGPAGTDLTGWSLVLYNGSTGGLYNTTALAGVIANQQGGFGTAVVTFPPNGIQNGAPDGIALVDGSNVVQFLSYEGAFVAVGGPANDLMSTDIGVSESSATAVGESLQLVGAGNDYGDFTWAAAQPSTFGAVNTGQTFGGGGSGGPTLLINETDADTPGIDAFEFVELYDGGAGNISLDGLVLVFYNGSDDASYGDSFDLDGYSTDANGYFLLGNPAVVPTPAITFPGNGLQNGADAVALHQGDAADFPNDTPVTTVNLVDAIVYDTNDTDDPGLLVLLNAGQPQVNEGGAGDKDNHSNQRCPNGSGGARNTNTFAQYAPTPGAENVCVVPVELVFIHEVQGNGAASPLVGSTVRIEGIVVGDFQDGVGSNGDLNGFYVQEEDADADGDPLTSEGIFIFNGSSPSVDVLVGDLVAVEGVVSEFSRPSDSSSLTEITSFNGVTVISSGNPLPTVTSVNLPLASADSLEPYEGMYVTLPQPLVIAEYFNFDRFGEIVLTTERQFQPTATYEPGSLEAAQLAVDNSLSRITLDDGRGNQNPDPAIHPNGLEFNLENLFRGGDTVANITGVLDYAFDEYRVQPTQGANYVPANPRPEGPDAVGGTATVASFNVLNYFTTLDDGGPICGPTEDMFCRGADTEEEFTRQRDKIIAALLVIDADIVGLIEIENHPGDVPTADLVSGLNALMGAGTYDYVATGAIGTDAIRQAFIYKPASVSLLGDFAILDSSVDPRFLDDYNRPALAQTFEVNETGGVFTAVVNHLKSKGSNCNAIGDPDTGDGAGNCNLTRKAAAEALVDWLAVDPTGSGDGDFLIIGDLNSYDKEDPIDAILAGGYTDLVFEFNGEDAYSYVFDGQLGYLDHALSNAALTNEVTGTTIWHINADEPDLIDYDTSFKKDAQDAIYAPDAYRSSDHDPVIVGLDLCEATPPQFDTLTVTPEVLWPANHKYVDVSATVVASDNFDPSPFVTLVSVTSNEPDNGEDDGNTVDDIVIVDDYEFKLRAERSGIGTGRTYTITYEATDSCGNSAIGSAIVSVPLGRGK